MDQIQMRLLEEVAGLHEVPAGAYNIRANGQTAGRSTTANIDIVSREDGNGIDIHIKPGTVHESVHIPVLLSQSGLTEMVSNDFYIGDDCDVTIVAGCGIHNGGDADSRHDGIHRFFVGKNAKIKYVEKHYGSGDGRGSRIMNPVTEVTMEEGSYMEMETVQIKGGYIFIDGELLNAEDGLEQVSLAGRADTPIKLEDNEYFLLGDNRDSSEDSRFPNIGNVKREQILGKAWFRMLPLLNLGFVS